MLPVKDCDACELYLTYNHKHCDYPKTKIQWPRERNEIQKPMTKTELQQLHRKQPNEITTLTSRHYINLNHTDWVRNRPTSLSIDIESSMSDCP